MTPQQQEARDLNRAEDRELVKLAQELDSSARQTADFFERYTRIKKAQHARSEAAGLTEADAYNTTDAAQVVIYTLRHLPGMPQAAPEYRDGADLPHREAAARVARDRAYDIAEGRAAQ